MAEFMFPFLSVEGDRQYSDSDFAMFYHNIFTNGVISSVREQLKVQETPETGMRVEVLAGAALLQGRQYLNTEKQTFKVTPGSTTADRTDLIVVRLDMLDRSVKVVYREGVSTLTRNENVWELQLARLNIPRNASTVFNQHITDTRADDSVCGYSVINGELPVSGLEAQYASMLESVFDEFENNANANESNLQQLLTNQESTFQQWFGTLQSMLDSNQAANLQAQIDQLYPDFEVATIEHNLGDYPSVTVLYWEYGLGTVGLEDQPEGISWDGTAPETIPYKVFHDSWNAFRLNVPADNLMTSPTVEKLSDTEYLLHEGHRSLKIKLGGI